MEIEELDAISAEAAQAFVDFAAELIGPAVGDHLVALEVNAALGGDDHLIAAGADRAANEVFALAARAVDVGGIEVIDAEVEAGLDGGNAIVVVDIERADASDGPAAEGDGRDR